MHCFIRSLVLLALVTPVSGGESAREQKHNFDRWNDAMAAFEVQDRETPPKPGGILFVGSSTIRLWNLEESFPDLPVVNRGFGGSEMIDSVRFFDRLVTPHQPRAIFVYAGSNDLSKGTASWEVLEDFQRFVAKVHQAQPETDVVFLSVKPTIRRWPIIHRVRAANELVAAWAALQENVHYLDVHTPMLNSDGEPESRYLAKDGLHLSEEGYRHLTELVRPEIDRLLQQQ